MSELHRTKSLSRCITIHSDGLSFKTKGPQIRCMQFHLIVVSIFLKTYVKDHGDSSSRLQERKIWLVCIQALLLAVFGLL